MPAAAYLYPQNAPKSLAAGGFALGPTVELTELPQILVGLRGLLLREEEKEERGEEERGEEERGWIMEDRKVRERRDF